MSDATYEVDSRNDVAVLYLRIHLLKCEHLGTIASSPWPDAVGLVMAFTSACHVERSFGKHLL